MEAPGHKHMTRPTPEDLLTKLQKEEEKRQRGTLKIFFGASAGVGKTYAMLLAAKRKKEEGVDVVIGVAETHGRKETLALLDGIETLPPARIQYRERLLAEFDLDAALARKPQLILVDELAHSNVQGSRHLKRWQDVQELLDAGIDVYTTVNVQHLESLNDIVGRITGIRVWETVPASSISPMKSRWSICRQKNCSIVCAMARSTWRNKPSTRCATSFAKAI
jgi:two-component system, OmpR family, sensor histidine kinase KdpD